jgi:hypothetical protein
MFLMNKIITLYESILPYTLPFKFIDMPQVENVLTFQKIKLVLVCFPYILKYMLKK